MAAFVVEKLDDVALAPGSKLQGMDLMSPFVWREANHYTMMVRGVPNPMGPRDPTGIIGYGRSEDGLNFIIDPKFAITPGDHPDDAGGCEDPTVLRTADDCYLVYYTGVDAARRQGSLILAAGPSLSDLTERDLMLKAPVGEGNIKEATLAQTPAGDWRLFYEYAANNASRIGMAQGPTPKGPWTVLPDPFGVRDGSWDNWHLSTGPVIQTENHDPVMFYNGATHDARWRVGWISFDCEFTSVTGRGLEPLLVPPPAVDRDATDIAFAASTVREGDRIALYYSLEDSILRRAIVRAFYDE